MGYDGVEAFDLHGHDVVEVRGWLDELELDACGLHAPLVSVEADIASLAATARGLGTDRLVSWVSPPTSAAEVADIHARLVAVAPPPPSSGSGSVHNHDAELAASTASRPLLERLLAETPELFLEPTSAGRGSRRRPGRPRRALQPDACRSSTSRLPHAAPSYCRSATARGRTARRAGGARRRRRMAARRAGRGRRLRSSTPRSASLAALEGFVGVGPVGTPPARRCGRLRCISRQYAQNARASRSSPSSPAPTSTGTRSEGLAREHGYDVLTVDEALADPTIDVVLNLDAPERARRRHRGLARGRQARATPRSRSPPWRQRPPLAAEASRLGSDRLRPRHLPRRRLPGRSAR
jgi:hypothetical protein